MAKFELKFLDCDYENNSVKTQYGYHVVKDLDVISIIIDLNGVKSIVNLDKSTAIKFAKTLRTEINKITEEEVNNE